MRVDASDQWDIVYGTVDGTPVWLPRGFFEGFPPSSGILKMSVPFQQVTTVPSSVEVYEFTEPVPLEFGVAYAIRSRQDPTLSFPCHLYAKISVDSIQADPNRVEFRYLWNPNCDQTTFNTGN